MEFDVWMYITVFIAQLIGVSLSLAIFSSLFIKSRKKGYLWLAFTGGLFIYQLFRGFNASIVLGTGLFVIMAGLGMVAFFVTKRKIRKLIMIDPINRP